MKGFLMILMLALAAPVWAAAPPTPPAAPAKDAAPSADVATQPKDTAPGVASDKAASAGEQKAAPTLGKGSRDNEYVSPYYSVLLPDGWKAVMPPHNQQGNISAIFATSSNTTVVTMVVGPNDGADTQTIASMFAEQFKATGKPTQRNGQYTFKFQMQNGPAQAWVATQGSQFMVTAISGNTRQGQDFLRKAVSSEQWRDLLPKL